MPLYYFWANGARKALKTTRPDTELGRAYTTSYDARGGLEVPFFLKIVSEVFDFSADPAIKLLKLGAYRPCVPYVCSFELS